MRKIRDDIVLDEKQKEAILSAFKNPITIITGPGGSGKSLICRYICDIAKENGLSVRLMSPTGKAAQVLSDKTGCEASTIHRSLKMQPGDDEPRENIGEDICIIDEISMSGIDTMYAIMCALEDNIWGSIVLVGDKNQLPSVSPGNFLSDMIESGYIHVVALDKVHRQDEKSFIKLLANEISKGKMVDIPSDAVDIKWRNINVDTFKDDLLGFIDEYLADENYTMDDLQIISPMKKGNCGVFQINEIIQSRMSVINSSQEKLINIGFTKFYVGDRVIQTENNYDKMVFNGDMGKIVDLGEKSRDASVSDKKEKFLIVDFYGNLFTYYGKEIEEIQLAWAITVHKFQGSQSRNILFIMANEAQIMMSKELVYTAFTRAEKKLDIFGHNVMLRIAPTKSVIRKRYTNLVKLMTEEKTGQKLFTILT